MVAEVSDFRGDAGRELPPGLIVSRSDTPTEPAPTVCEPFFALVAQGGNVIVSVSWNGATKVTKWRAHAGGQPGALTQVVEADRSGFETTLTVPGTPEYVLVEGLDATGKVLGTSSSIPVRV